MSEEEIEIDDDIDRFFVPYPVYIGTFQSPFKEAPVIYHHIMDEMITGYPFVLPIVGLNSRVPEIIRIGPDVYAVVHCETISVSNRKLVYSDVMDRLKQHYPQLGFTRVPEVDKKFSDEKSVKELFWKESNLINNYLPSFNLDDSLLDFYNTLDLELKLLGASELTNLEKILLLGNYLYLRGKKIEILPILLSSLETLTSVDLCGNSLQQINVDFLRNNPDIKYLNIYGNPLGKFDEKVLQELKDIDRVIISKEYLSLYPEDEFLKGMKNMIFMNPR